MILGGFLALCASGAVLSALLRSTSRPGQAVGLVFLAAVAAAALALGTGDQLTLGDVQLSTTAYSAAFLSVAASSCLLLCLVGCATQPPAQLAPAALAAFGGFGVALTSPEPRVSLMAGAAAAATGTMSLLHRGPDRPRNGPPNSRTTDGRTADGNVREVSARDGRLAEIRILGVVVGAAMLAALVVLRPSWTGHEDRAVGVAFLALVLAVAVSSGAVPFHVPAAHLSRNGRPAAAALLLVWIPAGLAMLALTWSPFAFSVNSDWMRAGMGLFQAVAVATIVLGGLAALVHDRLDEVGAYSIVSDAGFVLLALAARTEAVAEPARLWLLVFVAAKTGLVAWVAATTRVFGSSQLGDMRGWLRRTPLLGLGLVAIAVATLGWPGSDVARVRADLVQFGLPNGLGWVGTAAVVLSIGYYGRLLVIGMLAPAPAVRDASSERPRLGFWIRRPRGEEPKAGTSEAGVTVSAETVSAAQATSEPRTPEYVADEAAGTATQLVLPETTETAQTMGTPAPEAATRETPAPEAAVKPKRKRRTKTAAASEPLPSVTAAVDESVSGEAAEKAGNAASAPVEAKLIVPAPRKPRTTIGHRLVLIWRLNRTLEVSLVVLAAAALSLAVASGSFGAANAAQYGIPLGTAAHSTASPTPVPSLPPTQAPLATGTPIPSPPPTPSGAPSGSPSIGPEGSGSSAAPTSPPPEQPTPIIQ